jgi:hypothetical protein
LRSAPHAVARLFAAHAVWRRFGDQSGHCSPLYKDADGMKLSAPAHGLIMPVVRGGLVRSWLYYKHAGDAAPRWVSSSHLPGGCKVLPSIHVVKSECATRSRVCLIVGHALEAEAVAVAGIETVIGWNNVTPAAGLAQLQSEWPELAGVTLALDEPQPFLTRALHNAGLRVRWA